MISNCFKSTWSTHCTTTCAGINKDRRSTGEKDETDYGILKEVQETLAAIRTDLDSFCDAETKVHDSLQRVLTRVIDHYGEERIKKLRLDLWGGYLNVRRMRGGAKWSMHSWGIALDYDPERNKLKWGRDRAAFTRPEYDRWWSFWEEEGWVSLGRSANYDWMHVQIVTQF